MDRLPTLQGSHAKPSEYRLWKEKVSDQLAIGNEQWPELLDYIRHRAYPITRRELEGLVIAGADMWSVSKELFTCISSVISDTLYKKRK